MRALTKRRLAAIAVVVAAGGPAWRWGPYLWARSHVPMTFDEADLDKDGSVSLTEASYIASSGNACSGALHRIFCVQGRSGAQDCVPVAMTLQSAGSIACRMVLQEFERTGSKNP